MRKLTLMCVFVLFLTACAKTRAQEIPQKEKEVVIVDTTKKETQTLGDTTIKKETVAPTEVKKQEEKPTVEQPKKEEVKQKEENKNTKPVQPQPKKEVKVEQKPAPKVEQSKPVVKPEVPKSLPKPPVASAKPKPKVEQPKKDRYIVSPIKLKGDMVFKSEAELNAYVAKNFDDDEGLDKLEERLGKRVIGWRSWTVEWSDGVFEYHLQWY